jgi:short-subunit dehydrogenase
MKDFTKKYGTWALIAGAAEGIGEAFSRELASKKINLLMVDVQQEKMQTLALQLEKEFSIQTHCITLDFSQTNAAEKILQTSQTLDCRLLVYVAAFSRVKPFLQVTDQELDAFIDINCRTQLHLVHGFASQLKTKEGGGIILLSSLAGLIGMQLVATYAATKAFAWNLAEALHHELKPNNIDVMACIAGATATPTYLATQPTYGFIKPKVQQPVEVAKAALQKLGKRTRFIPGLSNRFNYFLLTRIMPRSRAAGIANKTMWKMYEGKVK